MKKKLHRGILSFIMCISLTALSVGATTVSQNEPEETEKTEETEETEEEAGFNEAVARAFMTDEVYEREMNAYNPPVSDIRTEAEGYRYLFLGDSTSGYVDVNGTRVTPYVEYFRQMTSAYIKCNAFGGATYSTQNGTSNVILQMQGEKLSDYDAVFMLFGVNDYALNGQVRNPDITDTRNLYGALNEAINRCNSANVKCYVILPFPCEHLYRYGKTNVLGISYLTYVETIREVCRTRGVEMIDFYSGLGVTAQNYPDYFVDTFHPNNVLQKKAAELLYSYLLKNSVSEEQVRQFVERLYQNCLLRNSDKKGSDDWTKLLVSGKITGTKAAEGFFFSKEFTNYNYSNEQYVELLYNTMLDRPSDDYGKQHWVSLLEAGVSRKGVFKGFADSREFAGICKSYGIEKGTCIVTEPRDKNPNLTRFISRLYLKALNRPYDIKGLNYWCDEILTGKHDITYVSTIGFFHSREFQQRGLSRQEYIQVLYWTFLDRPYDQAGYEYWQKNMSKGMSADEVLRGFSYSKEFKQIQKSFGL